MKFPTTTDLVSGILKRDQRAIAQAITCCENHALGAEDLLAQLFSHTGQAIIVGITGPPGSGKSTLVDQVALQFKQQGKSVAIIAVDPSSPFSGGAVLGDRIRMAQVSDDDSIYLRSLAARGALGGLSLATHNAVHILDAAGFDIILIETVGVGQAEVEIVNLADTCLVVVVPGLGDSVQSVKAGVLEIADIFVVNKYDRDGAAQVHRDIRNLLGLVTYQSTQWTPTIFDTVATQGTGVPELVAGISDHQKWLNKTGERDRKRLAIMRLALIKAVQQIVSQRILTAADLESLAQACAQRKITPSQAAVQIAAQITAQIA